MVWAVAAIVGGVIGTELGGIKEWVSHGVNGWLVPPGSVQAWVEAFTRLAANRSIVQQLRNGIGPVRTMKDVAEEMANLYREIC